MKCLKTKINKAGKETVITVYNCAHIGSNGEVFEDIPVCIISGEDELDAYRKASKQFDTNIQAASDLMLYVARHSDEFELVYTYDWEMSRARAEVSNG